MTTLKQKLLVDKYLNLYEFVAHTNMQNVILVYPLFTTETAKAIPVDSSKLTEYKNITQH